MIRSEILKQIQQASPEERIAIIEMLLQSLKGEIIQDLPVQIEAETQQNHPDFGATAEAGYIRGDLTAPVPEFGSAKGLIKMADDFDEPLEDFADYVP